MATRKTRTGVQGARVLVVDDYEDAREMFAEYLEVAGFRVVLARNGAEALELARKEPPDVILMDLSLPVMDGWEASRRLKQDPRTSGVPIVALSGHAVPHGSEQAQLAGCEVFLRKPIAPQDVTKTIEALRAQRAEAAQPTAG
jgi:two-component system, cell cycle response regulator DivK